jgi:hypothetical protein
VDGRSAGADGGPAAQAENLLTLPAEETGRAPPAAGAHADPQPPAPFPAATSPRSSWRALAGILLDASPERRRAAAEALLSLHPAWADEPFKTTREGFETLLRSALDAEKDPGTYGKMAEVAAILAEGRLKLGEPELTLETLSLLRRHRESVEPGLAFRAEIASRSWSVSPAAAASLPSSSGCGAATPSPFASPRRWATPRPSVWLTS